jgi:hypothetical protein
MDKIAAAELDSLLIKSANVIRSQQGRIQELEAQVANQDRQDHAEKIASIAVDRGIMSEDRASDYAAQLASSERDLGMVEEFVSHNNGAGVPLGDEFEKHAHASSDETVGAAEAAFNNFLLTSDVA